MPASNHRRARPDVQAFALGTSACALVALLAVHGPPPSAQPDTRPAASTASPPRAVAARVATAPGSCAATACHGSVAPVPGLAILGNEYTTWVSHDPHAQAYQTLFNERSRAIAERLATSAGRVVPPHLDTRCLACHSSPATSSEPAAPPFGNEGVACESCHGDATNWLGPHTTDWWKALDPAAKQAQYGFNDTKALASRASTCAGCHVGAPAEPGLATRDVNHDLIAAGHPRLNFEFAAFQDNLPHHWVEKGPNASPELPARAWLIGQIATARAAVDLLQERAADDSRPWPEFTEYRCESCHQSLTDNLPPETRQRPLGVPRWSTWAFGLQDDWLPLTNAADSGRLASSLSSLRDAMTQVAPDRASIAAACQPIIQNIDNLARAQSQRRLAANEVQAWISALDGPAAWSSTHDWDRAAQRYLALAALLQSWRALAPEASNPQQKLEAKLQSILPTIRFPEGYAGPAGFKTAEPKP